VFAVREVPLLIIIVIVCVVLSITTSTFFTSSNLLAMGLGMSSDAVIAIPSAALLIAGGFDLSVGSNLALSGIVAAELLGHGVATAVAILAALGVGVAVGILNGLIVTRLHVNPLVTTLGTESVVLSIALVMSGDAPLTGFPSSFTQFGEGTWGPVPIPVIIMGVVLLVGEVLVRRNRACRLVYYIGSNAEAARLSGIRVDRVRLFTYIFTGLGAAVAGIITTSHLDAAFPTAGSSEPLTVIAACVIGGCTLAGGEGSVIGAFLGVTLLAIVNNALVIYNVNINLGGFVSGAVLIAAVSFDQLSKRRRAAAGHRRTVTTEGGGDADSDRPPSPHPQAGPFGSPQFQPDQAETVTPS
jgi:ribose transport system permease protein